MKVSCLCPGPTVSKFRERAATSNTRMAKTGASMASKVVAQIGYEGYQADRRVVIAGVRNRLMVRVSPYLPRRSALRIWAPSNRFRGMLAYVPVGL